MNEHSVLCRFMLEHPHDFEVLLAEKYNIKVKKEGDYAIFNYGFECDFSDSIVQEARGIIIDCRALEVVCWPFRKFGNFNESYADEIDWPSARVLEKVDGSIIKLWYDPSLLSWQFSTNGNIRAENAPVNASLHLSFADVILRADNYKDIPFEALDKDTTYIFELVSPETQVVVRYEATSLYHIGTRNNKTGLETEKDIGIKKPASYPLSSLEECKAAAMALNKEKASANDVSREGFVVVDKNWHRVKVKSPDYLLVHHLKQMSTMSKRDCIAMILEEDKNIPLFCEANPNLVPAFKYYEYKLAELCYTATRLGDLARSLYEEYSADRGAVAKIILKHPLSMVAFRCLESKERGQDILLRLPVEKLAKLIPDYKEEDLSTLFDTNKRKNG